MKSIMISIKPEWVEKILNGEKTLEIRKTMPNCKEPCKVYIYCTNAKPNVYLPYEHDCFELDEASAVYFGNEPILDIDAKLNGKVVAEFTLNKITTHKKNYIDVEDNLCYNFLSEDVINAGFYSKQDDDYKKLDALCEFDYFVETYGNGKDLYAWHIDDLKIYDKPKELSEFVVPATFEDNDYGLVDENNNFTYWKRVQRAPQSWCYVEGESKC